MKLTAVQTPAEVERYQRWRTGLWCVRYLVLASIFLAVASVDAGQSSGAHGRVIASALVGCIYYFYLWVIAGDAIFSVPVDALSRDNLRRYSILCVALFASSLAKGFPASELSLPVDHASSVLLAVVYGWWAWSSYSELSSQSGTRRNVAYVWIIADALMSLLFGLGVSSALIAPADHSGQGLSLLVDAATHVTLKDSILAIGVLAWCIAKGLAKFYSREEYRNHFDDYVCLHMDSVWKGDMVGLRNYVQEVSSSRTLRVLDYECGQGARLGEFLDAAVTPGMACDVVGFDDDAGWSTRFERRFKDRRKDRPLESAKFVRSLSSEDLAAIDILHVSHVLYDRRRAEGVARVVQGLREGTLVVVRGLSSDSLLFSTHIQNSSRNLGPSYDHMWIGTWMKWLVTNHRLDKFVELRVEQDFPLNDNATRCLVELVELRYGVLLADNLLARVKAMRAAGLDRVPNPNTVIVVTRGQGKPR